MQTPDGKLMLMDKTVLTCTFLACATAIGLSIKPGPSEQLGLEQLRQGKYHQAAQTLESAVKANGPSCAAYTGLARAYNQMMEPDLALACADSALRFRKSDTNAWAEHATANLSMGNYSEAIADAQAALNQDSDNSKALKIQEKARVLAHIEATTDGDIGSADEGGVIAGDH